MICVHIQVPISTPIKTVEGCWFGLRITPSSTPNVSVRCSPSVWLLLTAAVLKSDWTNGVFPSTVDEYIAIAKEKHGYNVEQVGLKPPRQDPLLDVVLIWSRTNYKLQGILSSLELNRSCVGKCQFNFLLLSLVVVVLIPATVMSSCVAAPCCIAVFAQQGNFSVQNSGYIKNGAGSSSRVYVLVTAPDTFLTNELMTSFSCGL